MKNFPLRLTSSASPGVALVVTLMMMTVLTMMVVGLAGVMRNEQAAARNLTYQILAEQLADVGAQQAMTAVLSNSPTNNPANPVISCHANGPGWIFGQGTNLLPLFATNFGRGVVNLEEIGTNSLILSVLPGIRGQIQTGWIQIQDPRGLSNDSLGRYSWWVDSEGSKLNLNRLGASQNSNAACLVSATPLSAAFLFLNPRTGSQSAVDTNRGTEFETRTNYLFSTESLKDTNATAPGLTNTNTTGVDAGTYARTKGHVTAFSAGSDLTPWGSLKVNLHQTNVTLSTNQIMAALTTNVWTNFFGPGMSLARKFGGGLTASTNANNHGDLVMQQIVANILAARGTPVVLTNPLRDYQRANPATSFLRHRNSMPLRIASHYLGPYLEQVRTRVDWQITANTNVAGRLLLWVRVINPSTNRYTNWSVKVQPRKWKYVVAPASGAAFTNAQAVNLVYGPPLAGFPFPPDVGFNVVPGPAWEVPSRIFDKSWPLDRFFTSNNLTFNPRSTNDLFFASLITFTLANVQANELPATVSRAYVMLDQVGLYDSGTPNTTNLKDWLTHDDLAQLGNYRNDDFQDYGQFSFHPGLYAGAGNAPINVGVGGFPSPDVSLFAPGTSLGVRKIDPQARFPVCFFGTNVSQAADLGRLRAGGWEDSATGPRIWTTNTRFSCTNTDGSVTGIPYLWPDPAPRVTDVLDHPHFTPGFYVTNGFTSIGQLGAIHTGIPWRTLRLQPQNATERLAANGATNSPPDWILLDLFTATNERAVDLPMLNVNSLTLALSGNNSTSLGPVNLRSNRMDIGSPIRSWALLGALAALPPSNALAANLARNGVPITVNSNRLAYLAALTNVASNLQSVLLNPSNVVGWSTNSGWLEVRRNSAKGKLPTNGLGLRGEILEVAGLAEDTNTAPSLGEDILEGRLRGSLDYLSTRSDTFCVWSVGQATKVINNRTNVMSEVRKQTVFQRVPQFNAGGEVTGYQTKLLYVRKHVVE